MGWLNFKNSVYYHQYCLFFVTGTWSRFEFKCFKIVLYPFPTGLISFQVRLTFWYQVILIVWYFNKLWLKNEYQILFLLFLLLIYFEYVYYIFNVYDFRSHFLNIKQKSIHCWNHLSCELKSNGGCLLTWPRGHHYAHIF